MCAHLAWCLLVAVALAERDGTICTGADQHRFMMRWLSDAQRYKRFPREAAAGILLLQQEGKKHGVQAGLFRQVRRMWDASPARLPFQPDGFRLNVLMERLQNRGIRNILLKDREWDEGAFVCRPAPALYIRQSNLEAVLDTKGRLTGPLKMKFTGEAASLQAAFEAAFFITSVDRADSYQTITVTGRALNVTFVQKP